jgi:hypothetical protein
MIQSESEVEIRLIDNMTCTQIRSLMIPDAQNNDQKKLAEFVLNQSNETKIITVFEQESNWDFTQSKNEIFEKDFFEGIKRRYGDIFLERHRADGWTSEKQ